MCIYIIIVRKPVAHRQYFSLPPITARSFVAGGGHRVDGGAVATDSRKVGTTAGVHVRG